jgi:hypothetical protein
MQTIGHTIFPTVVVCQRMRLFASPKACDHFNRMELGKQWWAVPTLTDIILSR